MQEHTEQDLSYLDNYEKKNDEDLFNDNYVFKCRDGDIVIPRVDFMKAKNQEWMIGNMINDLETGGEILKEYIEIFETKNVLLSVVDTLRYNTLIIHDDVSVNYFQSVCDKWCVPEWIFTQSSESFMARDLIKGKIKSIMLKKCINCQSLFDLNENNAEACKRHVGSIIDTNSNSKDFDCCGGSHHYPCCVGYHEYSEFDLEEDIKKIDSLNKLMNLVNAKSTLA